MKHKRIYIILMVCFLLGLAACASAEKNVAPTAGTKPSSWPSETPTPEPTATLTPSPTPTEVPLPEFKVLDCKAYNEQILLTFEPKEQASFEVLYKNSQQAEFEILAEELITVNEEGNYVCRILGLSAGMYEVVIRGTDGNDAQAIIAETTIKNLKVSPLDRSGYAHFNNAEGIGAYNDDGTVKENTQIIYVTNENKNTITAVFGNKTYTGLVEILQNAKYSAAPLLIRISGKITTNQYEYKEVVPRLADNSNLSEDHFENTFSTECGENLVGLKVSLKDAKDGKQYNYVTTKNGLAYQNTSSKSTGTTTYNKSTFPKLKGKKVYDDDMNINSISIKGAKHITIEGITPDAEIFQFGFSFTDCNSIEVKNLKFSQYTEDAVAFYSSDTKGYTKNVGYWVHHCDFYSGLNNWDLTGEQDKHKGDGSVDCNQVSNITVSYCNFIDTGKTCLVASSDSSKCKNLTHHHNYYYSGDARLPFARGTNIHMYNNYYDSCSEAVRLRKSCYGFSENNYSVNCKKAHLDDDNTTAIKSYNDVFVSCSKVQSTKVTDRDALVENACSMDGVSYAYFDTDSDLFYYDEANSRSDVSIMVSTDNLKAFLEQYAGVKGVYTNLPEYLWE